MANILVICTELYGDTDGIHQRIPKLFPQSPGNSGGSSTCAVETTSNLPVIGLINWFVWAELSEGKESVDMLLK